MVSAAAAPEEASPPAEGAEGTEPVECEAGTDGLPSAEGIELEGVGSGAAGGKRKRKEVVDREVQATDKATSIPHAAAQEAQPSVASKGPAAKKAKSEDAKGDLQGVQWGKLISPYAQFLIGRVRPCNWQIPSSVNSGPLLCKLTLEADASGKPSVSLVSLSERGALSVNGHILKKNDKMKLLGGYEISIGTIPPTPGSKNSFAFIFQSCSIPVNKLAMLSLEPSTKAPEKSDASGTPAATERPKEAAVDTVAKEGPAAVEAAANEQQTVTGEKEEDVGGGEASDVGNMEVDGDGQLSKEALLAMSKIASMNVEPTREDVHEDPGSEEKAGQGEDGAPALQFGGDQPLKGSEGAPAKAEEQTADGSGEVAVEGKGSAKSTEKPVSRAPHPQLEHYREHFRASIKAPDSIDTTFENLGYYLGEGAKQRLLHVAFLHLLQVEMKKLSKLTTELPSTSQRIMLSSPHGSDIYQEAVVQALAKHCQARLLVYDRVALKVGGDDPVGSSDSGAQSALRRLLKAHGGRANLGMFLGLADDDTPKAGDVDHASELIDLTDPKAAPEGDDAAPEADHNPDSPEARPEPKDALDSVDVFQEVPSSARPPQSKMGGIGLAKMPFKPLNSFVAAGSPNIHVSNNPRGGEGRKRGGGSAEGRALKKGDRVRFIGHSGIGPGAAGIGLPQLPPFCGLNMPRAGAAAQGKSGLGGHRGPFYNCPGQVVLAFDTQPSKVGVRFDYAVSGGTSLGNLCEDSMGYWCSVSDLRLEGSGKVEALEGAAIDALFDVAAEEAAKGAVIIYVKDVETAVMGHVERFLHFKRRAEKLRGRFLLVGQHISDAKERSLGGIFARMGATAGAGPVTSTLLDLSFLNQPRTAEERGAGRTEQPKMVKMLGKLMPNRVVLYPPSDDSAAGEWKKMMERDIASMRGAANQLAVSKLAARCDIEIPEEEMKKMQMEDQALTGETAEKLLGFAVSSQLMGCSGEEEASEAEVQEGKLVVRGEALNKAIDLLKAVQKEASSGKSLSDSQQKLALKDVQTENEFEKRVLGEVIPAEEVGVSFDNIGALDAVKNTLREVVMLPLQRPELFARGALTKPTRGVLLFGPPGTGKTMLAKAVASESGANFINVSMSTMASKWFGEGEKYVKALFSLAHKIAPSVVFIDEVDSMLGRREKVGEHEAMRKIKNEFMSNWDGLKTKDCDRVLVLAATNRPFDLDEAVIRRLPRRLMVDLPDLSNRITILRVILKEEELEPNFDYDALAALTDGYTGSDLRNLCIAAAYRPIRDFLEEEKKEKAAKEKEREGKEGEEAGMAPAQQQTGAEGKGVVGEGKRVVAQGKAKEEVKPAAVKLRPLTLDDLVKSMEQICASVSSEAANMTELRQWNELYGEGGSRKQDTLTYFM